MGAVRASFCTRPLQQWHCVGEGTLQPSFGLCHAEPLSKQIC